MFTLDERKKICELAYYANDLSTMQKYVNMLSRDQDNNKGERNDNTIDRRKS